MLCLPIVRQTLSNKLADVVVESNPGQPAMLVPSLNNFSTLNSSGERSSLDQTADLSVDEGITINCIGGLFTTLARGESCQRAWQDIPTFPDEEYSFGTRGLQGVTVPLPFRFISSTYQYQSGMMQGLMSLGDGICVIEIDRASGTGPMRETAFSREIGDVAWDLLNQCTFHENGRGGVATGLGKQYQRCLFVPIITTLDLIYDIHIQVRKKGLS